MRHGTLQPQAPRPAQAGRPACAWTHAPDSHGRAATSSTQRQCNGFGIAAGGRGAIDGQFFGPFGIAVRGDEVCVCLVHTGNVNVLHSPGYRYRLLFIGNYLFLYVTLRNWWHAPGAPSVTA